jgi:hypothetical protein
MSTKKTIAGLAASSLLVFLVAAPAYAEDMPEMEKEQIEGTGPDVDPGASKGSDKSIVEQEKEQLEGTGPNVKPGATGADKPIPEMEKPE